MQCTARSKQSGVQCKRHAIAGGNVCRAHGGNGPQVKAKAKVKDEKRARLRHLPRTRERVIKEFRRVGRVDLACAAAGVDRTTHYWWMKNDPEYRKSFDEAREEACGLLEDEAVRRAVEGTEKPVTVAGKREMVRESSDQLLMFLLKCRNPKVFGDRRQDTVHIDSQLSVADVLRSPRRERLAREAAEEAAAKAAAITVDPQPLELEAASEEKQEGTRT